MSGADESSDKCGVLWPSHSSQLLALVCSTMPVHDLVQVHVEFASQGPRGASDLPSQLIKNRRTLEGVRIQDASPHACLVLWRRVDKGGVLKVR
jgi:hypothetical protein